MLVYMFFPMMALLIGAHTLRAANGRGRLARIYGASLVLVGLAMAGGLVSAEIASAAPNKLAQLASLH